MADRRIRIPAEFNEFIDDLLNTKDTTGPFRTQADVLAFAAAVGARFDRFESFEHSSREPIRMEVFARQNYDALINLLALHRLEDPLVFAQSEEMENKRGTIFEEYANGGLKILRNELYKEIDKTEGLLLFLSKEKELEQDSNEGKIDISQFLE